MFPPELKVKRFLDGLAYFYLLGHTNGIETEYKKAIHDKMEIPVSSCPTFVDNLMYASGTTTTATEQEERSSFKILVERLDEKASMYEQPKVVKNKHESKYQKMCRLGIKGGEWYTVDTDGCFWIGKNKYRISPSAEQYQPKKTEYGDLYDMDRILASGGKFYDMNVDEVEVFQFGGIVAYEEFLKNMNGDTVK